ncbi:MAG: SOS response-associated peptidase [Heteroscytonema crispum UTEX LB 1556]
MCGRFTLSQPEALAQTFGVEKVADLVAQYNIAPTQMVAAVLPNSKSLSRQFQQLRWGLIPSWAKDPSMGAKLINARAETVAEKRSFRSAFKRRRCLIVADGFYEWQHQEKKKQPFYIRLQDGQPFGFAGLWEQWKSPSGEEIDSCTIVTTEANELMRSLHDRMPVILNPQDYDLWLNPEVQDSEALQKLLRPYAASAMTAYPVSTKVNNPRHNSSDCIKPISEERHD